MAANATFALKPGLCVRRTRLVMVAPDTRHSRRSQAETPLIGLSEFCQPPLSHGLRGARHDDNSCLATCDSAVAGGFGVDRRVDRHAWPQHEVRRVRRIECDFHGDALYHLG